MSMATVGNDDERGGSCVMIRLGVAFITIDRIVVLSIMLWPKK
jgi:hypothetical protein